MDMIMENNDIANSEVPKAFAPSEMFSCSPQTSARPPTHTDVALTCINSHSNTLNKFKLQAHIPTYLHSRMQACTYACLQTNTSNDGSCLDGFARWVAFPFCPVRCGGWMHLIEVELE